MNSFWDIRVALSAGPLEPFSTPAYSDQRQRVGWLLLDSVRAPCETEAWLWLGRPFGGGSGINRALVFSPGRVPLTPHETGPRFVAIHCIDRHILKHLGIVERLVFLQPDAVVETDSVIVAELPVGRQIHPAGPKASGGVIAGIEILADFDQDADRRSSPRSGVASCPRDNACS